jgi:hypothetical protein
MNDNFKAEKEPPQKIVFESGDRKTEPFLKTFHILSDLFDASYLFI